MGSSERPDYLRTDAFLSTLIDAQSLAAALEIGLIDRLDRGRRCRADDLADLLGCEEPGLRVLIELLAANRVIEERDGAIALASDFRTALRYRDLLEAKIDFARCVAPDVLEHFAAFVRDPDGFRRHARIFDLFAYDRCFDRSSESYQRTRRWMRITTALTRYESAEVLRHCDFTHTGSLLDVGGNSGEFALRICREYPRLQATVFDLPLVCDIGREHVFSEVEADRIRFVAGSALKDALPSGFDLISFKSMLHDWPDADAKHMLASAIAALEPGGRILVFERGPVRVGSRTPPYSLIPLLLFAHSFRGPSLYAATLRAAGMCEIEVRDVELDTPFFLLTAHKPRS